MYTDDHTPIRSRVRSALQASISAALQVRPSTRRDSEFDVTIGALVLRVRWVGRCGPQKVREVLRERPRPEIIVGTVLSPGAREAAFNAGLGWIDESGAAELHFATGDALIDVSRPGHHRRRPRPRPRWTLAVLGTAEALLLHAAEPATVSAIRELTGYSVESTTRALRFLEDQGYLSSDVPRGRRSARSVADVDRLLDAYADAAAEKRSTLSLNCGVSWNHPYVALESIGERLDKQGIAWAVTGAMAASVLAPFATNITNGEVYVEAASLIELDRAAAAAKVKPMDGGRLTLRPFPTKATSNLSQREDELWIAPWPRVFADLLNLGVRGEEIAEHLKEVELSRARAN